MKSFVLICLAIFLSLNNLALSKEVKETINKNYTVVLNIPDDYNARYNHEENKHMFGISKEGDSKGILLITVQIDNEPMDMERIKGYLTLEGILDTDDNIDQDSPEETSAINEFIVNGQLTGYYTSVKTLAKPQMGFKKLMHGLLLVNGKLIDFKYYCNEVDKKKVEVALDIMKQMQIINVSKAFSLKNITLKQDDLPDNIKIGGDLVAPSMQTSIYYENPGIYKGLINVPKEKNYQTFSNGKESGSVIYMYFDKLTPDDVEFISVIIHGGTEPSADHPEEFFYKGNLLIIYCFDYKSELKEQITTCIDKKL